MAESTTVNAAVGLSKYPAVKQVGVMLGLSASIALGFAVVLWSQKPEMVPLSSDLDRREVADVMNVLQGTDIQYKLDHNSGVLLVAQGDLQRARIKLAAEGMSGGSSMGFDMLEKKTGFGTSQFVEQALYKRALEGELARSIASFQNIQSARVHLAIPKQASFVRNRRQPSASVFVDLFGGRILENEQVSAITHLVASSVPDLAVSRVTVTDEKGRLLTSNSDSSQMNLTSTQLDYVKNIEDTFSTRILNLLEPMVGIGKARAQVSADIDFTVLEETSERYNPQGSVVRSERVINDAALNNQVVGGVPGLPIEGVPEEDANGKGKPKVVPQELVRNFELDKTISSTRKSTGNIKRLSIAVLIDEKTEGEEESTMTGDKLTQVTDLVKRTVGFDEKRGDTINVVLAPFVEPEPLEPMAEPAIWEKSWFWSVVKQSLAGLVVLFLIFGVLRPLFRNLASKAKETAMVPAVMPVMPTEGAYQPQQPQALGSMPDNKSETPLNQAKSLAEEHPEQVAQVVRQWVAEGN